MIKIVPLSTLMLFIGVTSWTISSCGSHGPHETNFRSCSIAIYSPYGCIHNINLDSQGSGRFVVQSRAVDSISRNIKYDTSTYAGFKIFSEIDLDSVKKIANAIRTSDKKRTNRMLDAYQFVVSIDESEQINIYGDDDQVNQLLRILIKYLPRENDRCEFFELFKNGPKDLKTGGQ